MAKKYRWSKLWLIPSDTHVITISENGEYLDTRYGFKSYDLAKAQFDKWTIPGAMEGEIKVDGDTLTQTALGKTYVFEIEEL